MTPRDAILPFVAAALLAAAMPSAVADERSASDHVLKAEVALHGGDYLTAVRQYRKAAELSDSVEIAQQATRLGFDYGFTEDAVRAAKRWHELEPDSDEALLHLAQLQLRNGDVRAARRSFATLLERGDAVCDGRRRVAGRRRRVRSGVRAARDRH